MADYYDPYCSHCTPDWEANRASARGEAVARRAYEKTPEYAEEKRLQRIEDHKREIKRLKKQLKELKKK